MKYMKKWLLFLSLCYHSTMYLANSVPTHPVTYSQNLQKALILLQKTTVLVDSNSPKAHDIRHLLKNIHDLCNMQQEIETAVQNLPTNLADIANPTKSEIETAKRLTRKATIIQTLWPIYKREIELLYRK